MRWLVPALVAAAAVSAALLIWMFGRAAVSPLNRACSAALLSLPVVIDGAAPGRSTLASRSILPDYALVGSALGSGPIRRP